MLGEKIHSKRYLICRSSITTVKLLHEHLSEALEHYSNAYSSQNINDNIQEAVNHIDKSLELLDCFLALINRFDIVARNDARIAQEKNCVVAALNILKQRLEIHKKSGENFLRDSSLGFNTREAVKDLAIIFAMKNQLFDMMAYDALPDHKNHFENLKQSIFDLIDIINKSNYLLTPDECQRIADCTVITQSNYEKLIDALAADKRFFSKYVEEYQMKLKGNIEKFIAFGNALKFWGYRFENMFNDSKKALENLNCLYQNLRCNSSFDYSTILAKETEFTNLMDKLDEMARPLPEATQNWLRDFFKPFHLHQSILNRFVDNSVQKIAGAWRSIKQYGQATGLSSSNRDVAEPDHDLIEELLATSCDEILPGPKPEQKKTASAGLSGWAKDTLGITAVTHGCNDVKNRVESLKKIISKFAVAFDNASLTPECWSLISQAAHRANAQCIAKTHWQRDGELTFVNYLKEVLIQESFIGPLRPLNEEIQQAWASDDDHKKAALVEALKIVGFEDDSEVVKIIYNKYNEHRINWLKLETPGWLIKMKRYMELVSFAVHDAPLYSPIIEIARDEEKKLWRPWLCSYLDGSAKEQEQKCNQAQETLNKSDALLTQIYVQLEQAKKVFEENKQKKDGYSAALNKPALTLAQWAAYPLGFSKRRKQAYYERVWENKVTAQEHKVNELESQEKAEDLKTQKEILRHIRMLKENYFEQKSPSLGITGWLSYPFIVAKAKWNEYCLKKTEDVLLVQSEKIEELKKKRTEYRQNYKKHGEHYKRACNVYASLKKIGNFIQNPAKKESDLPSLSENLANPKAYLADSLR